MENAPALPPITTESPYRQPRSRRRSLVGPAILITLGLVLLGQNLGLLPSDAWLALGQFWPVLLVLAGAELIFGRSSLGATIATILLIMTVVAVLGSLLFLAPVLGSGNAPLVGMSSSSLVVDRLTQELGNAKHATIDLEHGAGRLVIGALPAGSTQLIEAELGHGQGSAIERSVQERNGGTYVQLRSHAGWNGFPSGGGFRQDWTIRLAPGVPTDLQVRGGASSVAMDLSDLRVRNLSVESGASEVNVTLPQASGFTTARVQTGAAGVYINVPAGVAARITSQSGLSDTNIDTIRFPRNGNYYQSPDYDTAANRVDLRIESGVSEITVR